MNDKINAAGNNCYVANEATQLHGNLLFYFSGYFSHLNVLIHP